MIRTLLIDDERLARAELKESLAAFKNIEIIAECANADEAITHVEQQKPDLLFLDIQMPGKNGFELLEELDFAPQVIFVTAFDEFAIKAFEVNALDYVLKPVQEERLAEAIEKVQQRVHQDNAGNTEKLDENAQVFVKDGDKCWFVQLVDVKLFQSEGNYVRVFFDNNKPMILKSLNNLEKRLNDKAFFRASRKHIINLKWIDKVENWFNGGLMVTLRGGDQIEISRRQAARLKEMMSL